MAKTRGKCNTQTGDDPPRNKMCHYSSSATHVTPNKTRDKPAAAKKEGPQKGTGDDGRKKEELCAPTKQTPKKKLATQEATFLMHTKTKVQLKGTYIQ